MSRDTLAQHKVHPRFLDLHAGAVSRETLANPGIVQIIYGMSLLVMISAAAAFVGAAMGPLLNAHSQSIWQSHTPRELQGRVFSIRRLIAWTILPASTAVGGTLAGLFNPGYVLAILGVIYALFSAAQLFNPYLLRVEDKA